MKMNANKTNITSKTAAVPNITVPIGTVRELAPSEILAADSTDYLLGGALTMRNGRIDKYLFDEGYCQALKVPSNPAKDRFVFYYYDRDHHQGRHRAEDGILPLRPAVLRRQDGQRQADAQVQRQGAGQDARPEHLRLRREAVQPRHRTLGQDGSAVREVLQHITLCVLRGESCEIC